MNKLFSSARNNWETPQDLFDKLDEEFHFTLDVCADDKNHKCFRYYTKEDDGFKMPWTGERVFCNPPYGREIWRWVQKAFFVMYNPFKYTPVIVMLLPARTDTAWFHDYIYGQENVEIRFMRGRLKFNGCRNAAPFPSMIVVYRHV